MTEQQYWVWVAAPDRYGTGDGGEHPDLDPAAGGTWWSCHRDTRAGDLAVLYRSREARDIAYRLRAVGDAYELGEDERATPGLTHACDVEVLERFERPIPLADLKADAVVAQWPALKASFARGAAPVPVEVWERLMDMAAVAGEDSAPAPCAAGPVEAAPVVAGSPSRLPVEVVVGAALGAALLAGVVVWRVRRRG